MKTLFAVACAAACLQAAPSVAAQSEGTLEQVFASVGDTVISAREYEAALGAAMRQRFYHRQVPEAEVAAFRREVADRLINRVLLLEEVRRRGIQPDEAKVRKIVLGYEARYRDSPQWKNNRDRMLPNLRRELEQADRLERLESAVRSVASPAESELRRYYDAHRDLFTEPEQVRLSVILLRVDPSSPKIAWEKAQEEAAAIRARIAAGADFASLARLHSADRTAENGGDTGYLHQGVLPEALNGSFSTLKRGEISEPVRVLEGYAIFRMEDRRPQRQRAFEDVKQRAGQLWQREEGERRWTALINKLRSDAAIKIDVSRYPELAMKGASGN